jgi:hypothetical protein
VATFPDERIYLARLDGIAPVNTLDLHGEDLIDDAKLAHIIEKNESSTGAQRWVAALLLKGRDLTGADLSSADVRHVDFSDAILNRANLQFAWAKKAHFDHSQLQGASLFEAQLQGASLDVAQLQGVSLNHAQLQGASFVDVCTWRADARQAAWEDTAVGRRETDPTESPNEVHECYWPATSFAALKELIAEKVPEGAYKRAAMKQIEQRLDPTKALEGADEMAKIWAGRERETPPPEAYAKSLARQWRELGCAAEGAPYVLQALIARSRFTISETPFRDQSDAAKALAAAFLDEHCAGAHGLSEDDKAKLKEIAAQAAPQAPKP